MDDCHDAGRFDHFLFCIVEVGERKFRIWFHESPDLDRYGHRFVEKCLGFIKLVTMDMSDGLRAELPKFST